MGLLAFHGVQHGLLFGPVRNKALGSYGHCGPTVVVGLGQGAFAPPAHISVTPPWSGALFKTYESQIVIKKD